MKKIYPVVVFVLFSFCIFSQNSQSYTISKKGVVNVKEAMKKDLKVKLENLTPPSPDGKSTRDMLEKKKGEISKKYPRNYSRTFNRSLQIDDTLSVGKSFLSNISRAGQPNDNSMAISNAGIVVSAFNSAIFIRDTELDSTLGELSLNQFSAQIGMNYDNFDPKMIYDPEQDRFILIYLAGRTILNSHIVVCYSQTNDPMGNWNVYSLSGNPLNDNSWSDFPAISMTKEDVFITINLLREGGPWQTSFKQTVIWQLEKVDGYSGAASVRNTLWSGIQEGGINIRNMHPVRGGYDLKSGSQYFLSNRNFAIESDSVYLIKVDNTRASGSAQISVDLLKSDIPYFLAPNAKQARGRSFATNDSRVLGGIIENGKIQYVHHGLDTNTGNCVIYHGVISNLEGLPVVNVQTIGASDMDYGYPNIVYGGTIAGENKTVIGFNHTGRNINAGISAVYFDGTNYSKTKMVKLGQSAVRNVVDYLMRWGDYFGMQPRYNEDCSVWMSGYYGENLSNKTWVAEVNLPGDCFDTLVPAPFVENTLFPNPSINQSEIHFTLDEEKMITIDLVGNNGKLIRILYDDKGKKGENRLIFTTENLASGIYFLRIYSEKEVLLTKKLVRR